MAHRLSTSSFKIRRLSGVVCAGMIGVGAICFLASGLIGNSVGSAADDVVSTLTKGRALDGAAFTGARLSDVGVILLSAGSLFTVTLVLLRLINCLPKALAVFLGSLLCFTTLNALILICSKTLVFWLLLYALHPTFKETSFHIERMLLAESEATEKVAILGSSQAASELDSGILTKALFPNCQFGTMHFAGSHASDLLLFFDYIVESEIDSVIVYLSPQSIYTKTSGHTFLPLMTVKGLERIENAGLSAADLDAEKLNLSKRYGWLGIAIPAFRIRRAVSTALFGEVGENGVSVSRNQANRDKNQEALSEANQYQVSDASSYEKVCLREFIQIAKSSGLRVVVLVGQVNPELEERLAREVQEDFAELVDELKSSDAIVLDESLPRHRSSDYTDWMHVRREVKAETTQVLLPAIELALGVNATIGAESDSEEFENDD